MAATHRSSGGPGSMHGTRLGAWCVSLCLTIALSLSLLGNMHSLGMRLFDGSSNTIQTTHVYARTANKAGVRSFLLDSISAGDQVTSARSNLESSRPSATAEFVYRIPTDSNAVGPDAEQPGCQGLHGSTSAPRQNASIILLYTSKASSISRRQWVRHQLKKNMQLLQEQGAVISSAPVYKFVIGSKGLSEDSLQNITSENAEHGDILVLAVPDEDNPDPPPAGVDSATSLKVAHGVAWAVTNHKFNHLVRLGDDSYFRVDYFVLEVAASLPTTGMMLGHCKGMHYRFSMHSPTIMDADVPYCSGMGFVMTVDAAEYIARNLELLWHPWPEDAAVASWFIGTKIKPVHHDGFVDWEWRACNNRTLMVHKHNYNHADINEQGVMTTCMV